MKEEEAKKKEQEEKEKKEKEIEAKKETTQDKINVLKEKLAYAHKTSPEIPKLKKQIEELQIIRDDERILEIQEELKGKKMRFYILSKQIIRTSSVWTRGCCSET